MIPITSTIKQTTRLSRKEWEGISPGAWKHAGDVFHGSILRRHFTPEGAAEYGYRPRDPGYIERKRKWAGHTDPLVLTGRLREQVLGSRQVAPFGRGRNVGVTVTVEGAYNRTIASELRAVSSGDGRELAESMATYIVGELGRPGPSKETRSA